MLLILQGSETEKEYDNFSAIFKYAGIAKKIADKYGLGFLPLQEKFNYFSSKFGVEHYLYDGVHPNVSGSTLIADEWVKYFKKYYK